MGYCTDIAKGVWLHTHIAKWVGYCTSIAKGVGLHTSIAKGVWYVYLLPW